MASLSFLLALMLSSGCNQGGGSSLGETQPGGVRGTIQLGPDRPAHGTTIFLEGLDRQARTDEQGAFLLTSIPPGTYTVLAERAGYAPLRIRRVDVVPGKTTDVGKNTMEPDSSAVDASTESAQLFGHAYLFGQLSHEGIVVRREDVPSDRVVTDPDGGFFMNNLPVGEVKLVFMAPAHMSETVAVTLKPSLNEWSRDDYVILSPIERAPVSPALSLERAPIGPRDALAGNESIIGRIEIPTEVAKGKHAEFVALFTLQLANAAGEYMMVEVTPEGTFTIRVDPGDYTLEVTSEVSRSASQLPVHVSALRNTLLSVTPPVVLADLAALGLLEGAVSDGATVDEQDANAATIRGVLELKKPEAIATARVALLGSSYIAIPREDGAFLITGIAPGRYQLTASAKDHLTYGPEPMDLAPGATVDIGRIVLEVDMVYPRVTGVSPANGARGVSIDETVPLRLEFDQEMNVASVLQALSITPEVSWRPTGEAGARGSGARVVIVEMAGTGANAPLDFRTRYTVRLADTALSTAGAPLDAPFSSTFTTAGPELIQTYPRGGSRADFPNIANPMVLYFNAPLGKPGELERSIKIAPRGTGSTPVVKTYNDNRTGWGVAEVFYNFEPETKYRIRIDARPWRTAKGARIENMPFSFEFTSPEVVMRGSTEAWENQKPRNRPGSPYRPEVQDRYSEENPYNGRRGRR